MLTYNDLVNDMRAGCKPRKDWRIGIEYERFAYAQETGAPLPYDGTPGIRHLLQSYAARYGWKIKYEGENPIALEHDMQTITLEPGGQVEYSGSPLATLAEVRAEGDAYLQNMAVVADELDAQGALRHHAPLYGACRDFGRRYDEPDLRRADQSRLRKRSRHDP